MGPTWDAFRRAYPDYRAYPAASAVKKAIGGAADADWIVNTCALRLSRGLNGSGVTVPAHFPGLATVAGADRKRYAFRVAEVRRWLPHAIGKADFDHTKAAGAPFDKATLAQLRGIIAFDIHFSDATGHFDSWDGTVFSHEYAAAEYWTRATRITVWKLS